MNNYLDYCTSVGTIRSETLVKLGNCFNNNIILQTITISTRIEMSSSKCKIRKEYLKDSIDSRNNFPVIIIR